MFDVEIFKTFCMFSVTVLQNLKVYTNNFQLASAYELYFRDKTKMHKSEKGHNTLSIRIHISNNWIARNQDTT